MSITNLRVHRLIKLEVYSGCEGSEFPIWVGEALTAKNSLAASGAKLVENAALNAGYRSSHHPT
jgi:hypothetical protein